MKKKIKNTEIEKIERDSQAIIPMELVEKKIYLIRGHKVMLDSDLAELYGVPVKVLNLSLIHI